MIPRDACSRARVRSPPTDVGFGVLNANTAKIMAISISSMDKCFIPVTSAHNSMWGAAP